MKILLIEDDINKRTAIEEVILSKLAPKIPAPEITYAMDLAVARRTLCSDTFDLIIFDMLLPESSASVQAIDCSEDLINEFSASRNYKTEAIALTQFEVSELRNIRSFNSAGITVVTYDLSNKWVSALSNKLERVVQNVKYDFLIFCALPKERSAFNNTNLKLGEVRKISGMDCLEASIDRFHGLIIKPQRMGLVNMAIIATKAIELFQPKIVAMSGICAGVKGSSNYLDVIVGSTCWEYQTGKWKDGEFKQEPYQVTLQHDFSIDLCQSTEDVKLMDYIRSGLYYKELKDFKVTVAPISSGSAVIADENIMREIGNQQRKMAALEMEMYSLYEAAIQSLCKPLYFGAKSVVDLGDTIKNDDYHEPACILSARYVESMLYKKLNELSL